MTVLLIALGPSVPGDGLISGVRALQAAGHRVHLIHRCPPSPALAEVLDGVTPLPPGRLRWRPVAAGKLRLDPDRLPAARRLARHAGTRDLLREAEVLVAVDQAAIPAVWLAARRRARNGKTSRAGRADNTTGSGPVMALSGLPAAQNRLAPP